MTKRKNFGLLTKLKIFKKRYDGRGFRGDGRMMTKMATSRDLVDMPNKYNSKVLCCAVVRISDEN